VLGLVYRSHVHKNLPTAQNPLAISNDPAVQQRRDECKAKVDSRKSLPGYAYNTVKMHKSPPGDRCALSQVGAGSRHLDIIRSKVLKCMYSHLRAQCNEHFEQTGVNAWFVIRNSAEFIQEQPNATSFMESCDYQNWQCAGACGRGACPCGRIADYWASQRTLPCPRCRKGIIRAYDVDVMCRIACRRCQQPTDAPPAPPPGLQSEPRRPCPRQTGARPDQEPPARAAQSSRARCCRPRARTPGVGGWFCDLNVNWQHFGVICGYLSVIRLSRFPGSCPCLLIAAGQGAGRRRAPARAVAGREPAPPVLAVGFAT
jgi:hypothetical protein